MPADRLKPNGVWTRQRRAAGRDLDLLGVPSPLLAQLLVNRGIADAGAAATYLDPPRPAAPALGDLAGLADAVGRIEQAIRAGQRIVVYGDYDVDGLTASTILQRALRVLGADVEVFVPHRDRDGYGLNADVLRGLAGRGVGLVITVDCGVTAAAEVAVARDLGLDIVVTDHHELSGEVPKAVAIVNPHRPDCPYPFKQLAGGGVALKLAQALLARAAPGSACADLDFELLQLAALATISDVMPLVGENRAIVRYGLASLNARPLPGIAALLARCGLERPWVTPIDVGYKLAPRLNAAGRLADAALAQRLLAATDPTEAAGLADRLEALNGERRALTAEAIAHARGEVGCDADAAAINGAAAIVVVSPYPAGLLGLVAVRLVEQTGRPVAVIERADEVCRGSVRAPSSFNAVDAVAASAEHLIRFGGHHGAAGFSLPADRIDAFRASFIAAAAQQQDAPAVEPPLVADARLRPGTIDGNLLDLLERLGPFGHGCPEPAFETTGLRVHDLRLVGEQHLRFKLVGQDRLVTAIAFGAVEALAGAAPPAVGSVLDVLYRVRPNVWRGERRTDVHLVAWRTSGE